MDKTKLILISTQVEVVAEVGLEKVLKINFYRWVGVGGWLDQVGIRLNQLSTELKLKLKLSLAIFNNVDNQS